MPYITSRTEHSLEERLYASLWMLANPDCYRCVGNLFNMGKNTLHRIFLNFVQSIQALRQSYVRWPCDEKLQSIADEFHRKTGLTAVVGCLDGTHISVRAPDSKNNRASYINRKGYASIQLQAVCTSDLYFTDMCCGFPGSVHDSRVFRRSDLRSHLDANPLPPTVHLLADTAYPLSIDVMTPYRDDGGLTEEHKKFNTLDDAELENAQSAALVNDDCNQLEFEEPASSSAQDKRDSLAGIGI
ncbi:putative nuclease HARBI1 [Patiria miniata]|uniref:DDE Tnp4 domain-containing protein n=1 Tax=Patiria miniata TaxID=46514 RepID=A0A914ATP4_PATMI|nr:putative nuclease HARBI1 [Patiria miniata]